MEEEIKIYVYVGFAVLVLLSFAAGFIYLLYGRKLLEREAKFQIEIFRTITDTEEQQKERIAKNLHDQIIPVLGAIKQSIEANNDDYSIGKFDLTRAKRDTEELEKIGTEIRNISHELLPASLRSIGVIGALEHHVKMLNTQHSKTDFKDETNLNGKIPFSLQDQTHIYRICLEVLNNLKKHSKFKYLKVSAEVISDSLTIDFMHDGVGITNEKIKSLTENSNGIGLKSIQGRVLILNGDLNYTTDNHAACITLKVPIKR